MSLESIIMKSLAAIGWLLIISSGYIFLNDAAKINQYNADGVNLEVLK